MLAVLTEHHHGVQVTGKSEESGVIGAGQLVDRQWLGQEGKGGKGEEGQVGGKRWGEGSVQGQCDCNWTNQIAGEKSGSKVRWRP